MTTQSDVLQVEADDAPIAIQDYAEKIRNLLAKAEATEFPAEAEAYTAKATKLMARYSITAAMLGTTKEKVADTIETVEVTFTGIYGSIKRDLLWRIASANRCRCVQMDHTYSSPKRWVLIVHGFTSDLETVKLLDASLQLQCLSALKSWEKEQHPTWHEQAAFAKYKDKRTFIEAFGGGVEYKLNLAMSQATKVAASERVAAAHGSETAEEATAGVALALRSRKDSVNDWFDKRYGTSLRSARNRTSSGGHDAWSAGRTAGSNADTGQTRVGGGARALGSGK